MFLVLCEHGSRTADETPRNQVPFCQCHRGFEIDGVCCSGPSAENPWLAECEGPLTTWHDTLTVLRADFARKDSSDHSDLYLYSWSVSAHFVCLDHKRRHCRGCPGSVLPAAAGPFIPKTIGVVVE